MASVYVTLVNANGNVDPGFDTYLIDASSNNVTLTLPAITSDGMLFTFRGLTGATGNTITILPNGSSTDTVDNNALMNIPIPGRNSVVSFTNNNTPPFIWYSLF